MSELKRQKRALRKAGVVITNSYPGVPKLPVADTSRYQPHQGIDEKARRVEQRNKLRGFA